MIPYDRKWFFYRCSILLWIFIPGTDHLGVDRVCAGTSRLSTMDDSIAAIPLILAEEITGTSLTSSFNQDSPPLGSSMESLPHPIVVEPLTVPPEPQFPLQLFTFEGTKKLLELAKKLDEREFDFEIRKKRIRDKLDRLRMLVIQQQMRKEKKPVEEHPVREIELPNPVRTVDPVNQKSTEQKPIQEPPQAESIGDREEESTPTGLTITDTPVDRLSLANNLYGAGEYHLALEAYTKVKKQNQNSTDQAWIDFQIGNCHRHIGDVTKSLRNYRVVTANPRSGDAGKYARWWLANQDRLNAVKIQLGQQQQLQSLIKEQLNGSPQSPNP